MKLFGAEMKQEDRELAVATMLGLSPSHPESWPRERMDAILRHCENEAERILHDTVSRMLCR